MRFQTSFFRKTLIFRVPIYAQNLFLKRYIGCTSESRKIIKNEIVSVKMEMKTTPSVASQGLIFNQNRLNFKQNQSCKIDCENCDYCEIANCDCEEIAISQTRQSGF